MSSYVSHVWLNYLCGLIWVILVEDHCLQVYIVFQNTLIMCRTTFWTKFMLGVLARNAPKSWLTLDWPNDPLDLFSKIFYETDVRSLACKWHLKQSCSEFHKLQKLCWWLFMKKLGTHPNFAHKPKISAVSTLSRIWLSLESHSFEVGLLGAL